MSNKRKLKAQKPLWGTMGTSFSTPWEPFGDWAPADGNGELTLDERDYKNIFELLLSRAEFRRMQEGLLNDE